MLLFGLVVHVAVVGAFQLLPAPVVQRINEMVALPFIAIFTVATLLLGTALKDLEERLATDRALSDSSARLRAITQAIPDVLLVLDRNGRYQEVLSSYQKEAPRLCRGGSRSLTFQEVVHRRDFQS